MTSLINRRVVLKAITLYAITGFFPMMSQAQVLPFELVLRRQSRFPPTTTDECLQGELLLKTATGERKLCDTLELPYRNNLSDVSAIPPGFYGGTIRTDGRLGWRIELNAVDGRKNIQIHPGNTTDEILGCILVGSKDVSGSCRVNGSRMAIETIRSAYGTYNGRRISLLIQA